MQHISKSLTEVFQVAFAKHHPLSLDLILNWQKIVGKSFNIMGLPVLLIENTYGTILYLEVANSSEAFRLEFYKQYIQERIELCNFSWVRWGDRVIIKCEIFNRRIYSTIHKNSMLWIRDEIDIEKMQEAASYLIGCHDFTSLRAAGCQALSPIKTLDSISITKKGEEIELYFIAKSFLYHMVRNVVGTLLLPAIGKIQPIQVQKILLLKDRTKVGATAKAHGLYFTKIVY